MSAFLEGNRRIDSPAAEKGIGDSLFTITDVPGHPEKIQLTIGSTGNRGQIIVDRAEFQEMIEEQSLKEENKEPVPPYQDHPVYQD